MDQFIRYIHRKVYSLSCVEYIHTLCLKNIAYPISQHVASFTHYFSDILCDYIKHLILANLPVNVMNRLIYK